jgi:type IV pilus assembly protein PilA
MCATKSHSQQVSGFTLTEVLVTVGIIGTLSTLATPSFVNALKSNEQSSAKATVAGIQTIISSYIDETGKIPKSWKEINSISAIMTSNGDGTSRQALKTDFSQITLPGEKYKLEVKPPSGTGTIFTIIASPTNTNGQQYIHACLDISNGASDLTTSSSSAEVMNLCS